MKSFKFKGKYTGDECLPKREQEGAIQFREPDMGKFAIIANVLSIFVLVICVAAVNLRNGFCYNFWGPIVSILLLVPHEFLHAIWMKGDVFMYENLKQGLVFVVSTEDLSKGRFIWMSLFPSIVFGFLPFILFMINPSWVFLGYLGAFSISMGTGDYCNVFFAATQMPKGSVTYLSGFHSYWYIPEKK